jgi:nucleoside-diphosphate-sugar epimerase
MGERALVTGGGRLDNFSTGRRERLEGLDVGLVEGDLRSYERANTAVRGTDVVFHLGALPSVPRSVEDPLTTSAVNVEGTLNVLLAARDEDVRRVVFASSSAVYGASPSLPKTESDLLGTNADPLFEPARPGEVRASYGDHTKARELLQWEPRWLIRDALDASIEGLVDSVTG